MAITYVPQSNVFAVSLFIGMHIHVVIVCHNNARLQIPSRDDDILPPVFSKVFTTSSALETRRTRDIPSRMNNETCVASDTNLVNVVYTNVAITLRINEILFKIM